jgi:signal transduction histidine kinase
MIEENRDLLLSQAQSKGIELVAAVTEPAPVLAHKHSINTVVRNLISNAIKFTPEKGIVKIAVDKSDGLMVVSVADTGVGMSKEIIEKLFRLDAKHSTLGTAQEKGTGLGLILCNDFVEKNGGTIWVESEPRRGSTFYFTIQASII